MKPDDIYLWFWLFFGTLAGAGAKIAWLLFGVAVEPPDDPSAYHKWARKRKWVIISELSALPAFATFAYTIGDLYDWPPAGLVLLSMCLGALGFAFFLDALQTVLRRKIGMDK